MTETHESMRRWAVYFADSPLYQHLVTVAGDDPDLVRIVGLMRNTPRPNVFLGAVQYLMARHRGSELERFFPNFVPDPRPPDEAGEALKEFVLDHEEAIVEIGAFRLTQTNECGRCVALLPAVWRVAGARSHLIDIGTSAGLNLALDHYRYRWNDLEWGPDSPVVIETALRGAAPQPKEHQVLSRVGIDLNPIDPADPDDRLWLESLIWPEHHERRSRLRSALEVAASVPIRFVAGDAVEELGGVFDSLPEGDPALVMNSYVFNQWSDEDRARLEDVVVSERARRPVSRVSLEFGTDRTDAAKLTIDDGTGWQHYGWAHHHAEWVEFFS